MTANVRRLPTFSLIAFALFVHGAASAQTSLPRAHAHNDYAHARPLADALARGFASVEADIWLVDGQLLVAHELEDVRPDRTLQSLYLDPLRRRVADNGGRVFGDGSEFLLWIDIKSDAESTYLALRALLTGYRDMLTRFGAAGVDARAVTVIVSGNRPRETMGRETERLAALDGRLIDLESDAPFSLVPFISDNWQTHFTWRGAGPLPEEERQKLAGLVERAHGQGRRIRFWAMPDEPAAWEICLSSGVDLINTDRLDDLRLFLASRVARRRLFANQPVRSAHPVRQQKIRPVVLTPPAVAAIQVVRVPVPFRHR